MTLHQIYPNHRPLSISLDKILSAAFHATVNQSKLLQSNKAFPVLRYLLLRLDEKGRGNLINAELTLAQTSIAKWFNMSRQWVGTLTKRLEASGWIEHYSPKLADGTNGSSIWRIGRKLQQLIVALTQSPQRKSPKKSDVKSTWHSSPLRTSFFEKKKALEVLAREKEPPSEAWLTKCPDLRKWLARGKEATEQKN